MFKELIELSECGSNENTEELAARLHNINVKLKGLEQRIFINIPEEKIANLVSEIFENFPEYGCYALECIKYDYENFDYWFKDIEEDDNVVYKVSKQQAVEGFKKFMNSDDCDVYFEEMLDAEIYDADLLDLILQYTLFGKIIYS